MTSIGAAPAPRLRIRRGTPEDAAACAQIHFEAFGPGVMGRLLNPNGVSEETRARFAGTIFPPAGTGAEQSRSAPEVIVMVAELVDDEGGDPVMVAYSKWTLVREQQPREEWEKDSEKQMTAEQLGPGTNVAVYNEFLGGLQRMSSKWMKGEPRLRESPPPSSTPSRHTLPSLSS
jgi:hypothetical protein